MLEGRLIYRLVLFKNFQRYSCIPWQFFDGIAQNNKYLINWRLSGDRLFSQVEETTETEVPGAPEDSSAAALAAAPAAAPAALAVLVVVAVTILQVGYHES